MGELWARIRKAISMGGMPFLLMAFLLSSTLAGYAHAADPASKYGPFSTRIESGMSAQTTGRSEDRMTSKDGFLQKKHEHAKGRLIVKLSTVEAIAALKTPTAAVGTDEDVLAKVRAVKGYKGMKRHFKNAKAPVKGEMIKTREGKSVKKPDLTRWHRIDIDETEDVLARIEELKKIPGIEIAEPDFIRKPGNLPGPGNSNPLYNQQWYLGATKAPQAWAHLQSLGLPPGGGRDVVVAVIDTGIDLNHPDLAANLWTAQDGSHGRDVISDNNNPMDDHGHGTHVAGIIAAQADNKAGGVGLAYNVQIMAIKAAQYSGTLSASDIAEGIYFAVDNGADVINMSFGGYGKSSIEEDALAIAFGQAVLVAAAGNDGLVNESACDPLNAKAMYPASYNWVLGIMASQQSPNAEGGYLASFSNYDCKTNNSIEYEVMAPGASIMSTLPNNQYAAWSGTSMATPVVSAIAALTRTKFADKNTYSSRFIMGQVAATGTLQQAYTPQGGDPVSFRHADALAALTTLPKPNLNYLEHWLFDTTAQNAANNNNGRIEAGETIDLAMTIRNQWGKADNVIVKLEAKAGVVGPDPYVTMITDTVSYGAVGSFSQDDNGLVRDAQGAIIGVDNPFKFTVSPTTPNGHVIPFVVTITAKNGFDAGDSTVYSFESKFNITVTNGKELPKIISEDMTLTKDTFWIVPDATLIDAGVTVTIEEGTKIQFYSSEAKKPYALDPLASITVKGTLNIIGTVDAPIEMLLAQQYIGRVISIRKQDAGLVNIAYAKVENPSLVVNNIEHSEFWGNGNFLSGETVNGVMVSFMYMHFVTADRITTSQFKNLGPDYSQGVVDGSGSAFGGFRLNGSGSVYLANVNSSIEESLFNRNYMYVKWVESSPYFRNNTVLNNSRYSYWYPDSWRRSIFFFGSHVTCDQQLSKFSSNAFLERYINSDPNKWMSVRYENGLYESAAGSPFCLDSNYWGTTSSAIISAMTYDFNDDFSLGKINYDPILTNAPQTAYPFVVNVALSNNGGQPITSTGSGTVTFTIPFNRDMNQTVQPQVSFGPAEPYTDYTVRGNWLDARTWVGTFNVSPMTGDGYQIMRVAGARAANDPWLVTGDDSGRFQFEIITTGAESMNLQASGGEGFVDLTWTQNDFDLLGGYNVYRSTTSNGAYIKANATIIPPQTKAYHDTNVSPGQKYFYKFKVVKTDMTESAFSNVATGTPLDTVVPIINHTPVVSASPGVGLSLTAQVTDNVAVKGVMLYFRTVGAPSFTSQAMTNTTGSTYSANIASNLVVYPGIEYYITATDGITTVNYGRSDNPYVVSVVDKPVVTSVSPVKGPSSGGTALTISGTNFKAGATVTLGGAIADSVVVVNSYQITCVTPVHLPAAVDVVVTNTDTQSGTKLRGFTFESDTASLGLPTVTAGKNSIVQIPIGAANLNGLAAADITVAFDPAVLSPRTTVTGSLTSGWGLAANTSASGQVQLSLASSGGAVTGSGTLAVLEFEVIGNPGGSTAITLSSISLNGGAILATAANGTVNVQMVYSVSGSVVLWNGGTVIPGVQMQLTGDKQYTAISDASGTYAVTNVAPGACTLRPAKSGNTDGITAYDASLVLQHAAGLITLTGYQAVAADVDKSGKIDSMDAFYILEKAADMSTLPFQGAGVVWEFAPSNKVYSNLNSDLTGENFSGILLGDVSGNWTSTGTVIEGGSPVILDISEAAPAVDQTLIATVSIDPQSQVIYSLDMVLSYDQAKGLPVEVTVGTAAAGWMMNYNLKTSGEIRIAMAGATPISTIGNLVTVKFNVTNGSQNVLLRVVSSKANEMPTMNSLRYMLGLTFAGTGGGSVSGGMSCGSTTTCNPTPMVQGTSLTLMPTTDTNSLFAGWGGDCVVNGVNCDVLVDSVKNVIVTFTEADKARTGKAPFTSTTPRSNLATAFSLVQADEQIQARAIEFTETLIITTPATFKGGYNALYSSNSSGYTTLKGKLTVGNGGRLNVERLKIKSATP